MLCDFNNENLSCPYCGQTVRSKQTKANCKKNRKIGVGTAFSQLTAQLGIKSTASCSCESVAQEMNDLGIEGCLDRKSELLAKLQENYQAYTLADKARAATEAIRSRLVFKLNPLKPLESLFDEAIERARRSEQIGSH